MVLWWGPDRVRDDVWVGSIIGGIGMGLDGEVAGVGGGAESCFIELTRGYRAVVDVADYEVLAGYKWRVLVQARGCYAVRHAGKRMVYMHREIMDCPAGLCCDHINHDGLDNRRANLRLASYSQNTANQRPRAGCSSAYKGVTLDYHARKWKAQIMHNRQGIHIGVYDFEIDAAIAYDDVAIDLFGEFACLNFNCRPEIRQWLEESYLFATVELDRVGG